MHAREVEQPEGEPVDQLDRALNRFLRLQRMDVGEARHARDLLVEARIVLHRARPEREEAEVDRIILPRQASVVANRFGLGQARKTYGPVALQPAETAGGGLHWREVDAGLIGRAELEDQRLFEHQCPVAGDGLRLALLVRGSGGPPA